MDLNKASAISTGKKRGTDEANPKGSAVFHEERPLPNIFWLNM